MSEKSVKKEQEKVADEKPKTNVEADASAAQNSEEAKKASEASVKEKPSEPDWKALYALTLADFDNYKKRAARDREDTYHYAEADILRDVLPSVDNLQLALDNAKDKVGDPFVDGVRLVAETLLKALKDHGAEPFDSVGKPLDTERMEAIATLPSAEIAEGLVSIESKKGWTLRGKVLRAAQVVVSSGAPGGAEAANG